MSEENPISLEDVVVKILSEKIGETNAKIDNLIELYSELGDERKTHAARTHQLSQSSGEIKKRGKPPKKSQANVKTSSRKRSNTKTLKRKTLIKETTFEQGTDSGEERDNCESEELLDTRLNATTISVELSVPVTAKGKFVVDSLHFSDSFLDSDNDGDSDSNSESSNISVVDDPGPDPILDSSHDRHSPETDSREGMMVACRPLYGEHTSDMVNVIRGGDLSCEESSHCSSDDSSHAQSLVWEQDDDTQDIDDYLQGGDSYYSPDPGYLSNGCDSDCGY